ncbi:MAG: helix-turn-helix domain-containing protein [Acidobacteria bacterium]|nr:helix-turn-helix domain-containing protein [Acidobacteriota bacterium]
MKAWEALLDEHAAAAQLDLSVAWLRRRRLQKQPPAYIKIGSSVRYQPEDLRAFIESRRINGPKNGASRE